MRSQNSSPGQAGPGSKSPRKRWRRPGPRGLAVAAGVVVAVAGTVVGAAAAGVTSGSGASRVRSGASAAGTSARAAGANSKLISTRQSARQGTATSPRPNSADAGSRTSAVTGSAAARAQAAKNAASRPRVLRTSCQSVAHIGDSTSVDLISPADLPNPAQRLGARYTSVGVRHLKIDASGGRSIVEEMPGQVNGYKVASAWRSQGYRGCWVFALGTNDTANVAAGSSVGMMARIDQMMTVAHGQPVMWVNTRTLLRSGYWTNTNEQAWDATLVKALAKYPNMAIFNWSAVAQPGWFLSDGIHYNSLGCAMRAKAIADALARAFPVSRQSAGEIVR